MKPGLLRRSIEFIRWPKPYEGPILSGRIDGAAYLIGWIATLTHLTLAICVIAFDAGDPWPIVSTIVSSIGTVLLITIVIVIHRRIGETKKLPREVVWQWWAGPWDSVGRLVWLPVRIPEAWRALIRGSSPRSGDRLAHPTDDPPEK
jgi:hypothetical protein